MRLNPLLIATIVLALLGGLVWYTREHPPENDDAAPSVVDLDEDQIAEVTVVRDGEEPITLVRGDGEGDSWEFGGLLGLRADGSSVGLLVSSLASLNAERIVSENVVEWGPYGLDEPSLSVAFKHEAGSGKLLFGRDTPTGSGVFARLEGDARLFTVYSYNKTSLDKSVFDLRDKRLLSLDEDSVSSIAVETPGRSLAFDRVDGEWSIVRPLPLRTDDFSAGDLARVVRTAEMTEVLAEDDGGAYSFANPLATIRVVDGDGTHELVLAKDEDTHYARSSDQPGAYAVSETLAEGFDKDVDEFRNKKLFDFGFLDPERVSVRIGDLDAVVARSEGVWKLESQDRREVSGEKVQTLLDRLRNLSATAFPSDDASAQASYGLDDPAVRVTVEPSGEDSVPETVLIAATDRSPAYAAREGEPSTYEVEQSAVLDIDRAVADVVEQEADAPEPEQEEDAGE